MKSRISAAVLLLLAATGCSHLPPGSAEEVHTRLSVLGVTSTTDLTGIKVTGKTVRAEEAKFVLTFPGFDHSTTAKGVVLANPAPDQKPATP